MALTMNPAAAEIVGLKALATLVNDSEAMERFLRLSGLDPQELRARAEDPDLLAAVLAYFLTDDALLSRFCEAESLMAQDIHTAQRRLSG